MPEFDMELVNATREGRDPTWRPYCLVCSTMERMQDLGVTEGESGTVPVQKFECRHCHAKHERPYPFAPTQGDSQ